MGRFTTWPGGANDVPFLPAARVSEGARAMPDRVAAGGPLAPGSASGDGRNRASDCPTAALTGACMPEPGRARDAPRDRHNRAYGGGPERPVGALPERRR